MFAINHAASALLFRRHLKNTVSFIWILLAVQFIEFLWVILNLLDVEQTTTNDSVRYVGDIHLSYMPYSHSIFTSVMVASLGGLIFYIWKRSWKIALVMVLAFSSHIVLDFLTHAKDLPLGFSNNNLIGLGLYASWPMLGFIFELGFGLFCWWYYKGDRTLLLIILLFNVANISMFSPRIPGLETFLAHKPMLITVVILAQILITLSLVGWAVLRKSASSKLRNVS